MGSFLGFIVGSFVGSLEKIVGSLEKPKSCHSLVCDSFLVPHTKYLLNLFDDIHYTAIFNPLIIVYVCSIFIIIRTDFRHIKHVFCHKKYSPKVSFWSPTLRERFITRHFSSVI